ELGDKVAAEKMLDEVKNSAAFTQNVDVQYLWLRKKAAEKLYRKSYQEAKTFELLAAKAQAGLGGHLFYTGFTLL
ncbi:MAG TPA: hypothetical protein DDW91_06685, partial [Shewanella frigidimarina]|nr:hypothetical protein [Shewanella frigidimarina]